MYAVALSAVALSVPVAAQQHSLYRERGGGGERDSTNQRRISLPRHLRRDVSSGIQAVWPPRVAVLFQFGRSLLRDQRALSGKPMFWQPYRCTTPGC